jgi:uridine kinase
MNGNTEKNNPYIIGIAGDSGVGKSTVAQIFSLYFGLENVVNLTTDDLHKWERTNDNWNKYTHLNAEANNLDLGDIQLEALSKRLPIYRSTYNHQVGWFNPPIKLEPKDIIIVDGLHSFYSEISCKLIDLKIFIDTDSDLKAHWKIIRDTEERGYKYNDVLDTIKKREDDNKKLRERQLNMADVVIKFNTKNKLDNIGCKNEKYKLVVFFDYKTDVKHEVFNFLAEYIEKGLL